MLWIPECGWDNVGDGRYGQAGPFHTFLRADVLW